MKQHAWVSLVFIIGCATGGVASKLAVAPVHAGSSSATRWEYQCVEHEHLQTSQLASLGAEGWELTSLLATHQDHESDDSLQVDRFVSCFKRPLS